MNDTDTKRMVAALIDGDYDAARRELARILGADAAPRALEPVPEQVAAGKLQTQEVP